MFVRPQRFRRWLFCRLPREDAAADYECGHDCPENPKLHLLHFGVLRRPSPLRPIIRRSAYQVLRSSPGSVAKLAAMRRASSLVSLSVTARLLGSSSTVEIAERLSVGVAEDEGLGVLLDRPGRRSPPRRVHCNDGSARVWSAAEDNAPPLPSALVCRRNVRVLHRERQRRTGARVRLLRGQAGAALGRTVPDER
jgi:hypothetical protein